MLHRCKGINISPKRKYNDSTRMLSGRTADSDAALHDPVDLTIPLMRHHVLHNNSSHIRMPFYLPSVQSFRHESLTGTENNLRVCMVLYSDNRRRNSGRYPALCFAVKSKECFKWNIETFLHQLFAAVRTLLRRHIASGTSGIFFYLLRIKIYIMTVATVIMRASGFTSVIPDMVATNDDPTDPREPTRYPSSFDFHTSFCAMIYITAKPFLMMEFNSRSKRS